MPPVLGPRRRRGRLVVLGRRQQREALAVAERHHRDLAAREALLDHHPRAGGAERAVRQHARARPPSASSCVDATTTPLPARSPSALTTTAPGCASMNASAAASRRSAEGRGGHAAPRHQLLGVGLRALDLGGGARRPEERRMPAARKASPRPAPAAPPARHHQVDASRRGQRRPARRTAVGLPMGTSAVLRQRRDARVARARRRAGSTQRALRQLPGERVLAPAASRRGGCASPCVDVPQWRKWRTPVNDHRHAVLVGGGDDLGVAHRAAGLDDGDGAGLGRLVDAVAEREERVRGRRRCPSSGARAFARRSAPSRRATSGRRRRRRVRPPAAKHDGVRLHVLADAPGEVEVAPAPRRVGARFVTTLRVAPPAPSRSSRSARAGRRATRLTASSRAPAAAPRAASASRRRFFFAAQQLRAPRARTPARRRTRGTSRRSSLRQLRASTARLRATMPPNARHRIGLARAPVGLGDAVAATATPHGLVCLTIAAAGPRELAHSVERRVEVDEVVVATAPCPAAPRPRASDGPARAALARRTRPSGAGSRRSAGRTRAATPTGAACSGKLGQRAPRALASAARGSAAIAPS